MSDASNYENAREEWQTLATTLNSQYMAYQVNQAHSMEPEADEA